MVKILTHVHIYYKDMWPELKAYLQNMTTEYDLYVTMVEKNYTLLEDIIRFKPDAHVDLVPNKGFDIAPFIDVLKKVDLNDYDYIIKLHTKRDMPLGTLRNGFDVSGNKWRKYLLKFLQDKNTFEKYLSVFNEDKTLGMIADYHLIVKNDRENEDAIKKAQTLLSSLKLQNKDNRYVMGTMFMVRAKLFEPIKRLHLNFDDFGASKRGNDVLPYGMELLLGLVIVAQSYFINDPLHYQIYQMLAKFFAFVKNFIWRKKESAGGKISIKFCKIPLITKVNKENQKCKKLRSYV